MAAATERALYHQAGQAWARLGWEQVGWVDWDEQQHVALYPPMVFHARVRLPTGARKGAGR
jgi:hypothetical protein